MPLCHCMMQEGLPAARALMDAGEMVPDALALDALLAALLLPQPGDGGASVGLLVDGFPRTNLQADLLRLLHAKLAALHQTPAACSAARCPLPSFKARAHIVCGCGMLWCSQRPRPLGLLGQPCQAWPWQA